MGTYINTGNFGFQQARNGEYVDKSGLIAIVNNTLNSERKYSCVTRARRFGKSMAAKMLTAYYDQSCDSRHLFEDLAIARDASFELKYDHTADTALDQIRNRHYPQKVAEYTGDMLLAGISYDRQTKQHTCQIEQVTIG